VIRVLSRCLAGLLLVVLASPRGQALAQQPVAVDIDDPAVATGSPGQANVYLPGGAAIDTFDLEVRFDPALVRVDEVTAAEGWQLIPQSVQVDRNGVVRAAGFAVGAACAEGARCDLLLVSYVGRGDAAAAGLAISRVELAAAGVPVAAEAVRPAPASDPLDDLPGDRPSADDIAGEPAGGSSRMPWYLAGMAASVVVVAAIIAVVRRRPRMEGDAAEAPEWDGDVDSFLDRVASLGTMSADAEDDEPQHPPS
jgi:hypothetical protein